MGWLKKENLLIDHKGHQGIRIKNLKKYVFKNGVVKKGKPTDGPQKTSRHQDKKNSK